MSLSVSNVRSFFKTWAKDIKKFYVPQENPTPRDITKGVLKAGAIVAGWPFLALPGCNRGDTKAKKPPITAGGKKALVTAGKETIKDKMDKRNKIYEELGLKLAPKGKTVKFKDR